MESYMYTVLFCFVFGLGIIIYETRTIKKMSSITIINLFGYMYALTYGFFPAIVILLNKIHGVDLSHGYYGIDYSSKGIKQIGIWFACSVMGYLALRLSYNIMFARRFQTVKNDILENNIQTVTPAMTKRTKRMFGKLQATMLVCFAIAVVSMFLWLRAYGGIWGLIKIADLVRDNAANVENSLAFFMRPAKMILSVCYMSLILAKCKYKTSVNVFFFLVSLCLSILMLIGLDGRMGMAMFLVVVILLGNDYLKAGSFSWKKIGKLAIVAVLAIIFILNMDKLTYYIRNGQWQNNTQSNTSFIETLTYEFVYIITGAQHAVSQWLKGDCPYLVGQDILAGLFAWFPSSIRPEGIINIWNYNTELSTIGNTIIGQLPCDFTTTSIYSLGILGPVVYGLFWGSIIKGLDYFHIKSNNPISDIFYCAIAMRVFRVVNYSLLYDFVLGMFDIFLAWVIWKVSTRIKIS